MRYQYKNTETGELRDFDFEMGRAPEKVVKDGVLWIRKFSFGTGRVHDAGGSPSRRS